MRRHHTMLLMAAALGAAGLALLYAAGQGPAGPAGENRLVVPGEGEAAATFAGGCFWCMESPFEKLPGVVRVIPGYTGGHVANPTYKQVSAGGTGHAEAVQVHYDPQQVTYEELLGIYWRQIDPTDSGGQFVDRGDQYRSEIFYHDEAQRAAAERSRERIAASGRFDAPIVTRITPAGDFYAAEHYHQDYYKKNPGQYQAYRSGSGRDRYLDDVWGKERDEMGLICDDGEEKGKDGFSKPGEEELKARLSPLQYQVTQQNGTERAFDNAFWDNKEPGIYVDVVSGEPLFSSRDKYASGSGWPSFTRPLEPENIVEEADFTLGMARTEVRSKEGDSHLGHVFPDGPAPTGLRYCMNSAALRFIPVDKLEEEGYGEYLSLFREEND